MKYLAIVLCLSVSQLLASCTLKSPAIIDYQSLTDYNDKQYTRFIDLIVSDLKFDPYGNSVYYDDMKVKKAYQQMLRNSEEYYIKKIVPKFKPANLPNSHIWYSSYPFISASTFQDDLVRNYEKRDFRKYINRKYKANLNACKSRINNRYPRLTDKIMSDLSSYGYSITKTGPAVEEEDFTGYKVPISIWYIHYAQIRVLGMGVALTKPANDDILYAGWISKDSTYKKFTSQPVYTDNDGVLTLVCRSYDHYIVSSRPSQSIKRKQQPVQTNQKGAVNKGCIKKLMKKGFTVDEAVETCS